MNSTYRITHRIAGIIGALSLVLMPQLALAGTAGVATQQVLPQGGTSCAPLFVSEVIPYIYDGELQSFDVVISDTTYVGIAGSAGDVPLPYNLFSRRIDADGKLRLHVDTTVKVSGNLPVSIVLLSSSTGGSITCLSRVAFTTDIAGTISGITPSNGGIQTIPQPVSDTSNGQGTGGYTTTSSGTSASNTITRPSSHTYTGPSNVVKTPTKPTIVATSSTSSITATFAKVCKDNGVYQLWFVLLAIFFVITSLVGLSHPPLVNRHGALPLILIGIPFLVLIGFWLLVHGCRMNLLIPIILALAAIIGLYRAYRTSPMLQPMIALPPSSIDTSEKK